MASTLRTRSLENPAGKRGDPEIVEGLTGIHQNIAFRHEAVEDIDRVEKGRILDDHGIGLLYGLAKANFPVVDAAVGDHRRAHPFGTEAWKCLGMPALAKGGDGQHFGGRHHALPAPAMDPNLKNTALPHPRLARSVSMLEPKLQ